MHRTFSASRVYTDAFFSSGKAGMSAFRRNAENASKSVHLHWQIFCVEENAQQKCASVSEAYKMCCYVSKNGETGVQFIVGVRVITLTTINDH